MSTPSGEQGGERKKGALQRQRRAARGEGGRQFSVNTERLERTLSESREEAAALFTTGLFGVFATIDELARDNTTIGDPGSLGGSIARFEGQVERNDERLERIATQQENLRAQLTRQFAGAETQIAASQSTLSFIRQQFEISNE